jgi:hypothetical protein
MRHALVSFIARLARSAALVLALAVATVSLTPPAEAGGWHGGGWHGGGWHGGGWHGGCCWGGSSFSLFFGFPGFYSYPAYAYYPPYPYPAYGYAPAPAYGYGPAPAYGYGPAPSYYPPVTVAQQAAPPGPPPAQYWYYCDNPRGYYPYVQSCGAGWKSVPAQPPGVQTP